ncbi:MAG: hypothetical protein ETSY1_28625 [Candidatus Entotheonella factor]|uniref:Uncharacterized protein n=1 Tax=Entotheonella factor TaxID=1429438 RepID=W4LCW5_ENTF1|nr:MAG: hypothetical protein ETSY1_28625 [Candidatus Entotheonella factor]
MRFEVKSIGAPRLPGNGFAFANFAFTEFYFMISDCQQDKTWHVWERGVEA